MDGLKAVHKLFEIKKNSSIHDIYKHLVWLFRRIKSKLEGADTHAEH